MWLQRKLEKVSDKILYEDDLFVMSDSIEGIGREFANWKYSLESKSLKINNRKQNCW